MDLVMRTSPKARAFIDEIVTQMLLLFPITHREAVGRINAAWGHLEYLGDDDLIFHERATYWAKTIYYGADAHWWLGEEGLKPLPYSE